MSLFQYSENKLSDNHLICIRNNCEKQNIPVFIQGINNTFLTVCQLSKNCNSGLCKFSYALEDVKLPRKYLVTVQYSHTLDRGVLVHE